MIIATTSFALKEPISKKKARELFLITAPTYRGVPGLLRKHYILSEDGVTAGGIYLWHSRAEADALYTDSWRSFVRGKYGTEPVVNYFENPVTVDNESGQISSYE